MDEQHYNAQGLVVHDQSWINANPMLHLTCCVILHSIYTVYFCTPIYLKNSETKTPIDSEIFTS